MASRTTSRPNMRKRSGSKSKFKNFFSRNSKLRPILFVSGFAIVGAFLLFVTHAMTPPPVLPIASSLSADWTAPAGTFSMPAQAVKVSGTLKVDLSAATITGNSGYLFDISPGSHLSIIGGSFSGPITGLVADNLSNDQTASVSIAGTSLKDAHSVVFAGSKGGPISLTMTDVTATGLGDGFRGTADLVDIESSTLTGGGTPPSGNPAGIHMLDDNAGNVAVSGTMMKVFNSTITGFTSNGFQGDSLLGETRVASADIENNSLGHNSDSGGIDSKMRSVTFKNNTIYSDGDRAMSSHYGSFTSSGNIIYQVAKSPSGDTGKAYQGSGTLNASNDTVELATGALLAQADVVLKPGSGPPSTYPRVGNLILTHITDQNCKVLQGPTKVSSGGGYTPTIKVNLQGDSNSASESCQPATGGAGDSGNGTTPPPPTTSPPVTTPPPVTGGSGNGGGTTGSSNLTVEIISPKNKSRISKKVNIGIVVNGGPAKRVRLLVDGKRYHGDFRAPYNIVLNTRGVPNGKHALQAIAFDDAGNSVESSTITTNIHN